MWSLSIDTLNGVMYGLSSVIMTNSVPLMKELFGWIVEPV